MSEIYRRMNLVAKIMRLKLILFIILLLLGTGLVKAQNIEYGLTVDTNYMMIGDQQHLTLLLKGDPGIKATFPQLKDTVTKGVEIISGPVRDSVKEKDGRWLFRETYVITAFDTGVYVIPSMSIILESNDYNSVVRTDPVGFVVNTYKVDEQKGAYDIVMPYGAPWSLAEVLPYIMYIYLGICAIVFFIWLIIYYRKKKPLFDYRKAIPPYLRAIGLLDEIKNKKLWQSGKEKEYYTILTDVIRQYLDGEFQIPAMEQTSFETIRSMESCKEIERHELEKMATLFQTADYVKFAKFVPLQDENARYLDHTYEFVNSVNQKIRQKQQEVAMEMQQDTVADKNKETGIND